MLHVTNNNFTLSVIVLIVVMLSLVVPLLMAWLAHKLGHYFWAMAYAALRAVLFIIMESTMVLKLPGGEEIQDVLALENVWVFKFSCYINFTNSIILAKPIQIAQLN